MSTFSYRTSTFSTLTSTSSSSSLSDKSIFPQTFGIYQPSSKPHLVLAHSSKSSSDPFFYISIHSSFRSKPDITLHHGRSKAAHPLASAEFKGWSSTPHITLGSTRYGAAPTEALKTEGFFHRLHYFSLYLEGEGRRERFEWKSSCGPEVRALGHSTGMKLVRVQTREVVAAYADVSFALYKRGKMAFLDRGNGREGLGDEWRVMVIMTLLAILEQRRIAASTNAATIVV